jgi:hypothetical protein
MKPYRHILFVLFFLPVFTSAFSQVIFKTIIPQRPIELGESFQVQYIIENANELTDFSPPKFLGFRVVSGPNIYPDMSGSKKNMVFTLAAVKEGKLKIGGATCLINGKLFKSNDATVQVLPLRESDESSYFLRQGEDPYKKIEENLFLKLILDKQNCFIGEPLVATFKLYSRLQSKSNIIKNPGFYGFSVYDMVDVNDKVQSQEKVNGHWFDVHTVRKLQLYPLEPGSFTIDAMELANEVEFSRSVVNKKTEQQVSENMYGRKSDDEHSSGSEIYQVNIKSDPVVINVKPLPGKNPGDTFTGAVGNFSLISFVERDSLLKNEEDSITITVDGAGNFQQVSAPVIRWPKEFEVFEPTVKDTFNKQQVPLSGQRSFKYIFVCSKPGTYTIPSGSFSFFDLKTKTFKTILTKPTAIYISSKGKNERPAVAGKVLHAANKKTAWWPIAIGLLVSAAASLIWLKTERGSQLKKEKEVQRPGKKFTSVEEVLEPAWLALHDHDKIFYEALERSIWDYFNERINDPDVQIHKKELADILTLNGITNETTNKLLNILHQCEQGIYTNADLRFNKRELFDNTREILLSIERLLQ